MAAVNELLTSLNKSIADSNESLAEQGAEMVSKNAEWIDGEINKIFEVVSPDNNASLVQQNSDRLEALAEKAKAAQQNATKGVERIEADTKLILDMGDEIAARRARIQAEREKVVANQRRSSELMSK